MLRAILFDFDGTIADTEPLHLDAFRRVLGPRGIPIGEREYYERYLAGTDRECLGRMLDDYGRPDLRPELDELHRQKLAVMDELLSGDVRLFPGFRDFVREAARVGPLAIVTGAVVSQVKTVLRACGLESRFAVLVGAEDVRRGKPDPEGYLLGCDRLRTAGLPDLRPAECLAVEDAPSGIAAARAAGMRTLALAHSRPAAELAAADRVAAGYGEVGGAPVRSLFER